MASGTASGILKIKGEVYVGVTDLTTTAPYGGTQLGYSRDITFKPGIVSLPIFAEEWGCAAGMIHGGAQPVLSCVFRTWDPDALLAAFPFAEAGDSGEVLTIYQPAKDDTTTVRPGRDLEVTHGIVLAVMPRAPDAHPCVVLYNAVPAIEEAAELMFRIDREFGVAVAWHGLPDDSGRVAAFGHRRDITL